MNIKKTNIIIFLTFAIIVKELRDLARTQWPQCSAVIINEISLRIQWFETFLRTKQFTLTYINHTISTPLWPELANFRAALTERNIPDWQSRELRICMSAFLWGSIRMSLIRFCFFFWKCKEEHYVSSFWMLTNFVWSLRFVWQNFDNIGLC